MAVSKLLALIPDAVLRWRSRFVIIGVCRSIDLDPFTWKVMSTMPDVEIRHDSGLAARVRAGGGVELIGGYGEIDLRAFECVLLRRAVLGRVKRAAVMKGHQVARLVNDITKAIVTRWQAPQSMREIVSHAVVDSLASQGVFFPPNSPGERRTA